VLAPNAIAVIGASENTRLINGQAIHYMGRRGYQGKIYPVHPRHAEVLMRGAEDKPLLVIGQRGEGRVALLLSDHTWLWARGYDGGGPYTDLLRRLAHWLMKEPDLEEETLKATSRGQTELVPAAWSTSLLSRIRPTMSKLTYAAISLVGIAPPRTNSAEPRRPSSSPAQKANAIGVFLSRLLSFSAMARTAATPRRVVRAVMNLTRLASRERVAVLPASEVVVVGAEKDHPAVRASPGRREIAHHVLGRPCLLLQADIKNDLDTRNLEPAHVEVAAIERLLRVRERLPLDSLEKFFSHFSPNPGGNDARSGYGTVEAHFHELTRVRRPGPRHQSNPGAAIARVHGLEAQPGVTREDALRPGRRIFGKYRSTRTILSFTSRPKWLS
jgi:hypothetical protein